MPNQISINLRKVSLNHQVLIMIVRDGSFLFFYYFSEKIWIGIPGESSAAMFSFKAIMVHSYDSLFNSTTVSRVSDSMTVPT